MSEQKCCGAKPVEPRKSSIDSNSMLGLPRAHQLPLMCLRGRQAIRSKVRVWRGRWEGEKPSVTCLRGPRKGRRAESRGEKESATFPERSESDHRQQATATTTSNRNSNGCYNWVLVLKFTDQTPLPTASELKSSVGLG